MAEIFPRSSPFSGVKTYDFSETEKRVARNVG